MMNPGSYPGGYAGRHNIAIDPSATELFAAAKKHPDF
jgi:hypothetical protein